MVRARGGLIGVMVRIKATTVSNHAYNHKLNLSLADVFKIARVVAELIFTRGIITQIKTMTDVLCG